MFIPLGFNGVNKLREQKLAKAKGYDFISYISPNATIAKIQKLVKIALFLKITTFNLSLL